MNVHVLDLVHYKQKKLLGFHSFIFYTAYSYSWLPRLLKERWRKETVEGKDGINERPKANLHL